MYLKKRAAYGSMLKCERIIILHFTSNARQTQFDDVNGVNRMKLTTTANVKVYADGWCVQIEFKGVKNS